MMMTGFSRRLFSAITDDARQSKSATVSDQTLAMLKTCSGRLEQDPELRAAVTRLNQGPLYAWFQVRARPPAWPRARGRSAENKQNLIFSPFPAVHDAARVAVHGPHVFTSAARQPRDHVSGDEQSFFQHGRRSPH